MSTEVPIASRDQHTPAAGVAHHRPACAADDGDHCISADTE